LSDRGHALEVEVVATARARALRRLAEALGIAPLVRFRGWLRFDEVRRAMSEATVLVHPSTAWATAYQRAARSDGARTP